MLVFFDKSEMLIFKCRIGEDVTRFFEIEGLVWLLGREIRSILNGANIFYG